MAIWMLHISAPQACMPQPRHQLSSVCHMHTTIVAQLIFNQTLWRAGVQEHPRIEVQLYFNQIVNLQGLGQCRFLTDRFLQNLLLQSLLSWFIQPKAFCPWISTEHETPAPIHFTYPIPLPPPPIAFAIFATYPLSFNHTGYFSCNNDQTALFQSQAHAGISLYTLCDPPSLQLPYIES